MEAENQKVNTEIPDENVASVRTDNTQVDYHSPYDMARAERIRDDLERKRNLRKCKPFGSLRSRWWTGE